MTAQEAQKQITHEPKPINPETVKPEELLDLENYHSLYPRLLIAGTSANEGQLDNIRIVLNPEKKFSQEVIDHIKTDDYKFLNRERKYNPVVNGLSTSERRDAWKGKEFKESYAQWSGSILSSIHLSDTDERKEFLGKLFEKNHAEINDDDILKLYDKYCRGSSDIDGFLEKAIEHSGNIEDVQWLAKRLFGKVSGEVTTRIYELESAYKLGDTDKVNTMLWGADLARYNTLSDKEEPLLSQLSNSYEQTQTTSSKTQTPSPIKQGSNKEGAPVFANREEKIKAYEEAIKIAENGERPIDPATGKPLTTQAKEQAIMYLKEHMDTLIKYNEKIKADEENKPASNETARTPEISKPDMRIRTEMVITDTSGDQYYMKITRTPALSVLLNAALAEVRDDNEVINPITNTKLELPKEQAIEYLNKQWEKAKEAEAKGESLPEELTPVTIIRISDDEVIEEITKGTLWGMWKKENPKYIRHPMERRKFKLPDGNVYILQTSFNKDTKTVNAKFYSKETDPGNKSIDRLTMPMDKFMELYNNGEIEDSLPISNRSEPPLQKSIDRDGVIPGTFMAESTGETDSSEASSTENKWTADASYKTSAHDEAETTPAPVEPEPDITLSEKDGKKDIDETTTTLDDFDPVTSPEYDWGAALIAARKNNPKDNLYREGSSFSKLIGQLDEKEIIPNDINKKKIIRQLRKLQLDAESGGIPLPTKNTSEE